MISLHTSQKLSFLFPPTDKILFHCNDDGDEYVRIIQGPSFQINSRCSCLLCYVICDLQFLWSSVIRKFNQGNSSVIRHTVQQFMTLNKLEMLLFSSCQFACH